MISQQESDDVVGGRYAVGTLLGTGGAAVVHRAVDSATGRTIALKRLREGKPGDRQRLEELFRQEFHTLAQLSHPNVVAVYDYGIDGDAPYYTMELLDGGDLFERVPVDWRTACSIGRDVCSALSLVHSRRLVYRDLSPRNVRCTAAGAAKLLDFGALSSMGRARMFVGTLAFSAPEAVRLQPMDGRTDLFSLGATLYFAITGKKPYAAGSLAQLATAFQTPPRSPSQLNPDVPRELDSLVLDMIQLDPALRPPSAAEVMDRLGAIAGLDRPEHVQVPRAYLSTPMLVGRDASLERLRRRLGGTWAGKGGALLIRGPRGVGRSRFLDACVLEAKLSGATVARADAEDAASGDYGVARALSLQVIEAAPEAARVAAGLRLDVLATLVPELRSEIPDSPAAPAGPGLQPALREWLLAVAKERPLVLAVDDVHAVDAPSASLIALLAREASAGAVLVLATLPADGGEHASKAMDLLDAHSRTVQLGPLSLQRTERLLQVLFGAVPNLQLAARTLHAVSGGLPRDVMHLAQHLVDTGLARYDAGAWTLSSHLDGELPADMADARRARVDALTPGARALAQAFALGSAGTFTFDECIILDGEEDPARVMKDLDDLTRAELVLPSGKDYSLAGQGYREALRQSLTDGDAGELHARLARVYERRPSEEIRVTAHLFAAGEEARGLDLLVHFSEVSYEKMGTDMEAFARLLQSLPERWLDVFDRALELCDTLGRPPRDKISLYNRITGILSQRLPRDAAAYCAPLFAQLRRDSGLDLWEAAADVSDPRARLEGALGKAFARHASGTGGTVHDPKTAITYLGRAVAAAAGSISSCLDIPLWTLLPPLGPFAPLAPALSAWQALIDGIGPRITAQTERARALYLKQLDRIRAPDRAGLDETYQKTQELGIALVLGTMEAGMGLESALERARVLESSPMHDVMAKRVRMLHHLWQGDLVEAERYRTEAEVLSVEKARAQTNEGAHLPRELQAHALSGDLMRVKRALAAIEPLAAGATGWRPVLHWARAEHERLRGNFGRALAEIEKSLDAMHPLGHPVWPDAAACRVRILLALDRLEEARSAGEQYLSEAERRGIGYERNYIRMPLALALARLGTHAEAIQQCEAVLESFQALGTRGLNLGLAYETRARVALEAGDLEGFEIFATMTRAYLQTGKSAPLAARLERMMREREHLTAPKREGGAGDEHAGDEESVLELLRTTSSQEERLSGALSLLVQDSGASDGVLLRSMTGRLTVQAKVGDCELPPDVLEAAQRFWDQHFREDDMTVVADASNAEDETDWYNGHDQCYHPVLLSHRVDGTQALTGMAVLHAAPGVRVRYPGSLAQQVSRFVLGDQSAMLIAS